MISRRHVTLVGALAGLFAVVCSSACIQVVYERVNLEEPIATATWKPLRPGAEMQHCLDQLGAPFRVQKGTKGGFELIYRWHEQSGWGLRVSYNFSRWFGVSYDFSNTWASVPALRLRFDSNCRLLEIEKGLLGDFLTKKSRRRDLTRFGEARQRVR